VKSEVLSLIGTNVIHVWNNWKILDGESKRSSTGLVSSDAEAIAEECPAVLAASPFINHNGQAVAGDMNCFVEHIAGTNTMYLTVRNWQLARGGFFTAGDVHSAAKVCVIGQSIAEKLFPNSDPIGQSIRLRGIPFEVIGLLEPRDANIFAEDLDNIILMPVSTMHKRLFGWPADWVGGIMVSARSADRMEDAIDEVKALLRERHRIGTGVADDFEVKDTTEYTNEFATITTVMTILLGSIAGVSLIVGGIGIMNIMLVSVTERTREIGVRMAVGARPRDILRQFLVEAILLSTLGGLLGVALGVGFAFGLAYAINTLYTFTKWPVVISVDSIFLSLVFAGSVGLFFGFYPARKASKMDPIDALRYE
jgi:putative ABC transport system permease protein